MNDQVGRIVGRRVTGDWFDADLPANVDLHEDAYLFSAYAFNHYRSERACGVRVGEGTGLYDGTMFELGPDGSVEIGRYGILNGPVFAADARIVLGSYCYLSYEVFLTDRPCPVPGAQTSSTRSSRDEPVIVLGDDCWVGLRSVLLPGAHLGNGVIVGAGTVVDFPVPDYAVVAGSPARIVGHAPPGGGR